MLNNKGNGVFKKSNPEQQSPDMEERHFMRLGKKVVAVLVFQGKTQRAQSCQLYNR